MKHRAVLQSLAFSLVLGGAACNASPGRPTPEARIVRPDEVSSFDVLFANNCAGCHGHEGKGAASIQLGDPLYLAIADDSAIRHTTEVGVPGTPMPAFAQSAGGMLTDRQIDVIVRGVRSWAKPDVLGKITPPPHQSNAPGDPQRGVQVYTKFCGQCHGPDGNGGAKASSIVDSSYLALVSDQGLRTNVIVGRPEIGFPDFRNDVPGDPLSAPQVGDVVAWIAAQRIRFPGQPYSDLEQKRRLGELP
jgi:mono/diheme cytochrome c family protein